MNQPLSNSCPAALFDPSQALDALGGDRELLRLVARAFVDDGPRLLARLRAAVDRGDAKEVQASAHALKGTVRFFGDNALYDLAYSLETGGRTGNLDRAPELIARLAIYVPQLQAELAPWCGE